MAICWSTQTMAKEFVQEVTSWVSATSRAPGRTIFIALTHYLPASTGVFHVSQVGMEKVKNAGLLFPLTPK